MTNYEKNDLLEMQRNNTVCTDSLVETLWSIGECAGIPHYASVEYMVEKIVCSNLIDSNEKVHALNVLARYNYRNGIKAERRNTAKVLKCSWIDNNT